MNAISLEETRVLALDPTPRGFGFAVLEGPQRLIDWGGRTASKDKNKECLDLINDLLDRYSPEILVVENCLGKGSRRCPRVQELIDAVVKLSKERRIKSRSFSRSQVRNAFLQSRASTKHEIAAAIARQFPELSPKVPPYRQPWMSEDYRMAIFDAVAMGLTFFHFQSEGTEHTLSAIGIDNHVQE